MAARNQIEQDLLDLLAAEQKRNASPVEPVTKTAAVAPMGSDAYLNYLHAPSPGRNTQAPVDLSSLWEVPPTVASVEDPLTSLWNEPTPQAPQDHLASLWSTPEQAADRDLEGLWDAPGSPVEASSGGGGLESLFMNADARAQAEVAGMVFDPGEVPLSRTASSRTDFNVEFDADFQVDDAPVRSGGFTAPRYRVDRPPPARPFNRSVSAGQDGVVVGQRGTDGRFRTAAVQPRVVAPGTTITGTRPQPPPAAPQPTPKSNVTAYDVIRKGGLDL